MHVTTAVPHTALNPWRVRGSTAYVVVAALIVVFVVDRQTGSAPLQHLYYLPIILAAVRFKMRGGLLAALAAVVLYHIANPHLLTLRYEESDIVQITLFLAIGTVTARLTDDAHRLHALAMTDDLTGLHNLRSFEAHLAAMMRTSRETDTPVSLLVLDVDRLKAVNDAHGHLAGADAVRSVGHVLAARLPPDAIACRYGGDEFVVAVPFCTEGRATRIADDLRGAVYDLRPVLAGAAFPTATLSISVGLACHRPDSDDAAFTARGEDAGEALFRAADAALYRAKASGRNHVWVA